MMNEPKRKIYRLIWVMTLVLTSSLLCAAQDEKAVPQKEVPPSSGVKKALEDRLHALKDEEKVFKRMASEISYGRAVSPSDLWKYWLPPAVYAVVVPDPLEEFEVTEAATEIISGMIEQKESEAQRLVELKTRLESGEPLDISLVEEPENLGLEGKLKLLEDCESEVKQLELRLEELRFERKFHSIATAGHGDEEAKEPPKEEKDFGVQEEGTHSTVASHDEPADGAEPEQVKDLSSSETMSEAVLDLPSDGSKGAVVLETSPKEPVSEKIPEASMKSTETESVQASSGEEASPQEIVVPETEEKKEKAPLIHVDLMALADTHYMARQYKESRLVYEKIDFATHPVGDWILYRIARCHECLGDFEGARKAYLEVGKVFSDSFWAKESEFAIHMVDLKRDLGPIHGVPPEAHVILERLTDKKTNNLEVGINEDAR